MIRKGMNGVLAVLLVLLVLALSACGSPSSSSRNSASAGTRGSLLVSAAASLKGAFTEIGKLFDQQNHATTTFNVDAAGALQKQIEAGAPADVFVSAAPDQVNNLLKQGLVEAATVKTFASNEIVLVVPAGSKLGLTGFQDLAGARVTKIAMGNPDTTPLGKAAIEILTKLGLLDKVKAKLITPKTSLRPWITCPGGKSTRESYS